MKSLRFDKGTYYAKEPQRKQCTMSFTLLSFGFRGDQGCVLGSCQVTHGLLVSEGQYDDQREDPYQGGTRTTLRTMTY